MLDQRRAKEQGFITLKEAAEIANYTPDYVGQLIRAGKIKGEQVYSSVAWVTTEDEVKAYLQDKARTVSGDMLSLSKQNRLPYITYVAIAFIAVAILLLQYVFYVSLDVTIGKMYTQDTQTVTMHVME